MSVETMLAFLENCSLEEKLGFRVVTQCAPVLKGIKVSNIITVQAGGYNRIKKYLKGSKVICIPLYSHWDKEILFFYRLDMLKAHLKQEKVQRFLKQYGYQDMGVSEVLLRLRQRYADYAGKKMGFPHELGVILEYPVEDVEGFIQNQGKNCLAERYWKVYHDKEQAEQIFRLYDQAKETAMKEIVAGFPLSQVAIS